jgi:hypothetical protein
MMSQKSIVAVCTLFVVLFFLFVLIAFNSGQSRNLDIVEVTARMEFAFAWTFRAAGCLLAIIAGIHLIRFAGQGDFAEHMVPGAIALLGGLLLLSQHWIVVTAFAVMVLAFILQQLLIRVIPAPGAGRKPSAGNKAGIAEPVAVTDVQADRG